MVGRLRRMNMLKEFKDIQKDNDYIILTTYTFDPPFFDNFLLQEIVRNNPSADILVLVDAEQYRLSYEHFTNNTGIAYPLVPVYVNKGVFHPKFFLFISKKKNLCTAYVGSGNLTLHGFTKNAELITKIGISLEKPSSNAMQVLNFFSRLIKEGLLCDAESTRIIKEIGNLLRTDEKQMSDTTIDILDNIDTPIINQLSERINSSEVKDAFIFSPYVSGSVEIWRRLLDLFNMKKITLSLQNENSNLKLEDIYKFEKFFSERKVTFEKKTIEIIDEPDRLLHSKILFLSGKTNALLIGSANFTISALLRNARGGNVECGAFVKRTDKSILNELELFDFDDTRYTFLDEPEPIKPPTRKVLIYSAEFHIKERNLVVNTNMVDGPANIIVYMESPEQKIEKRTDLKNGKIELHIPSGIPIELCIEKDNIKILRRIYYEESRFLKRVARGRVSLKEFLDMITYSPDTDLMELINSVLNGVSFAEKRKPTEAPEKHKEGMAVPSKIKKSALSSGFLHDLNRVLSTINTANMLSREGAEISSEPIDETEIMPKFRIIDDEEEMLSILTKTIDKLNLLFLSYIASLQSENTEISDDEVVLVASVSLITAYLNLFEKLEEVNSNFEAKLLEVLICNLEEDWEGARKKNCSLDSQHTLFAFLIILNIRHNSYHGFYHLDQVVEVRTLFEEDAYLHIKDIVYKYFDEGKQIEQSKFFKYYSHLIQYLFSSKTVESELIIITKRFARTNNPEIADLLGTVLDGMKNSRWSISNELYDEMKAILIEIPESEKEKKEYIKKIMNWNF